MYRIIPHNIFFHEKLKEIAQFFLSKAMALTIFKAAAVGQKDQIVKALAHNAEYVLNFSADGWTALHLAAFFGHKEIVEVLIQAGAKINVAAKNEMAVMPLHSALSNRNIETAKRHWIFPKKKGIPSWWIC